MWIKIISIALIIVGIFIGNFNVSFVIGISLFLLGIYMLNEAGLMRLIKGVQQTGQKNNCKIILSFYIKEILNVDILNDVFHKLKKNKIIDKSLNKKEWIEDIIKIYQKKYKNEDLIETVTFNIKDNLLLTNNQIDYDDVIFHEIKIPYKMNKKNIYTITDCLSIRVLMINGLIKLQIGNFDEDFSPEVVNSLIVGGIYKNFYTITRFPFMYFSQAISKNFLNFNILALDSYFNNRKDIYNTSKKNNKNTNTDYFQEWKMLSKDIKKYEYMHTLNPNDVESLVRPNKGKLEKTLTNFRNKGLEIIYNEKFKEDFDSAYDDYYGTYFGSHNIAYSNKYLRIFIQNFKNHEDDMKKYKRNGCCDYWESFG